MVTVMVMVVMVVMVIIKKRSDLKKSLKII